MELPNYIVVEGPIGVGKSSLARILAKDLNAKPIVENPDLNPFLEKFYQDPAQYAFQTQLYFLVTRYQQQKDLKQQDLFENRVVCDTLFAKDLIFAKLTLAPEEYDLYEKVYRLLDQNLPKPDVTIFLQARPEVLMRRIKKRKKDYETDIDPEYIKTVAQAYSEFFFQYTGSKLLVVNTSGIDFVHKEKDYQTLKSQLVHLVESGLDKHYVTIDHE